MKNINPLVGSSSEQGICPAAEERRARLQTAQRLELKVLDEILETYKNARS